MTEKSHQCQDKLARSLGFTRPVILYKQGKLIPYELKVKLLNFFYLLVNSCFISTDFYMTYWLSTKNGFITTPSAQHYGNMLVKPKTHSIPNRILTVFQSHALNLRDQLDVMDYKLLEQLNIEKQTTKDMIHDFIVWHTWKSWVGLLFHPPSDHHLFWHTAWLISTSGLIKK